MQNTTTNGTNTTKTIRGIALTLTTGGTYRASRPMAAKGQTAFDVTITRIDAQEPNQTIKGLSYDASNKFLKAFNNGRASFDGRVW